MITIVGSLNMDLVVHITRLPRIGETIIGERFMTFPGGKGANQAVAVSRLGGRATMIGCVGHDLFGKELISNLTLNGVNVSNIKTIKEESTGVAVITVNSEGDNCIILDPGANFGLSPEDITSKKDIIMNSKILLVQLEVPLITVKESLEIASENNVMTILNPAPARELDCEIFSMIDIITPNETECEFLTGVKIHTIEDAGRAIKILKNKGVKQVIITAGNKGVYFERNGKVTNRSVPEVEVVDTTAAGDAFNGALAVSLSKGMDIDDAIDFCNIVGTLTVMKSGAQASLPTLKQVEEYRRG